jgi:two-component system osmolarity sensor histidine kinase EnvZ
MSRSPTLFWRTFLLVSLALLASLLAWFQSFRAFEHEPRAQQIAQQLVSIVNVTRSALLYSDPTARRDLLAELADNEGIRIVPREPGDRAIDHPGTALAKLVRAKVQQRLGADTRLASEVNGVAGNWISFSIEGDAYWVFVERDPLSRNLGTQWTRWALIAALLSLLAAVAITRVVNLPLARLARAAGDLGAGRIPADLPERGPAEIRRVNQSFNRMVGDLQALDQDRAVLLAGISHDLRTPLTRLRLEAEMSATTDAARAAMVADIDQMDAAIGQFLDYARSQPREPARCIDLSALVAACAARHRAEPALNLDITPGIEMRGHPTDLQRAIDNLIANALRYGVDPANPQTVTVSLRVQDETVWIEVIDHGPGIAAGAVDRLRRPFERGNVARNGDGGVGLGLAIVERIARMHGGTLQLLDAEASPRRGLRARLALPYQPDAASGA